MLDLNFLYKNKFFKKITLKPGELLFLEWEKNQNLYIIKYWELYVEKFINKKTKETKILAILKQNEIFWEAALNNNLPKQVSIRAKTKSELIYISASELEKFRKEFPDVYSNILKYIIYLSNKRLNEANKLIASSYKISLEITKIENFNNQTIFNLIEKIKETIQVDKIIFLERNPVLENYLILKYTTEQKWKMQDQIINVVDNKLDLLSLKIKGKYNHIQNINIWNKDYWILVFIKDNEPFSDNEIKIITSISISFAWVLKQKKLIEEQKNKEYLKEY